MKSIRATETLKEIFDTTVLSKNFIRNMSKDEFLSDNKTIFAVTQSIMLIGKNARNLDSDSRKLLPNLPWNDLVSITRKLNLPYQKAINPEVLWETIKKDFPVIESEIRKLLRLNDEEGISERKYIKITLKSYRDITLTPRYLGKIVYPYLIAISDIQKIINEIKKNDNLEVEIKSISQNSPLSVSLKGATEATELIRDVIIPWRRKHAQSMAKLLEVEKYSEIESKKADILNKRVNAVKGKAEAEKIKAEAELQRQEAEKIRLENEKLKIELHRAKIQLALDVISQIAPDLPETDRISHLVRLLPQLDTLGTSEFELDIIA
ncbi:HepT-like ribonuclease domain-containing protein [Desulfobacterium sp. N47]|uniref:Uncharacterized protein n=1 Tax=uncultured Desulfobacterium sp. TaxID=201089 RepID=E1YKH5_9BACT|nr:hypothetical protein N47_E41200 [uncultured Desulfobacterium sp.]